MTDANPAKFKKLVTLLRELFQLDQPDLDFGIYRIMHAKAGEVTQFLERDLLPQVKDAFAQYQSADSTELKKKLDQMVAQLTEAGVDPESAPKVRELREQIKGAIDIGALENEVYDQLHSFFRRYYSEGDFLAKRIYKPGVYAIPYEGEEVTLHWANKDQYYIKTSEYLRDYAFRLKPEAGEDQSPMRVHFRLVDAAEGEHGNVKAAEGKDRVFVLAGEDFIGVESGELEIRFEYRPATFNDWTADQREGKKKPPTQKDLTAFAVERVLASGSAFADWLTELKKSHIKTDGEQAEYTRLEAHLRRYTARNTFDYFIHKDLGSFLRRELDFYIKNEVMHLDDLESETSAKVEQYLSKIKVIRRIAGKIIDFLAQLENFQKKLWLKKKFVVGSEWLVAISQVPDELLPDVCANTAQLEEWKALLSLRELPADLMRPAYSEPLTESYLRSHPSLMVDTRHFSDAFVMRLLEIVGELDDKSDGVLVHSENFQALNMVSAKYKGVAKCICIDPPYNTGSDGFVYKDSYRHSSWLSQQKQTLPLAHGLLSKTGSLFAFCDENEVHRYALSLIDVFAEENLVETITWNKRVPKNDKGVGNIHDYAFLLSKDAKARRDLDMAYTMRKSDLEEIYEFVRKEQAGGSSLADARDNLKKFYRKQGYDRGITLYCEMTPDFRLWGKINMSWPNPKTEGPRYEVINPVTSKPTPIPKNGWRWKEDTFRDAEKDGPEYRLPDGSLVKGRIWYPADTETQPSSITYLDEVESFLLRSIISTKSNGSLELEGMGLGGLVDYPKPTTLIEMLLRSVGDGPGLYVDYFAGSGTTGHSVLNLRREDGVDRRFMLVEMSSYFESAILPRLKKASFAPEWKDRKPLRLPTAKESERSPRLIKVLRLESYEDTLNNLALSRTAQQATLEFPTARGADGLREQYFLRYQLDVESRDSASLLNIAAFADPTAYKLKIKTPGSDESREVNVDLLETFNWLLGLTVQHIAAPRSFTAEFERDSEGRLQLKGRLKQDAAGPWWFRTVTGTTPEGRKTLVIWRKLIGDAEQDNLVLETWFRDKQAFSVKDTEFDLIYVNGDNTLENLRLPDESWKVRLTEEDFQRLMFEGTEA
jgi:adenine-specific DNA-methyltransferase